MDFITALVDINNNTTTANGAPAFKSTMDANLDFFSMASRNYVDATTKKFRTAFIENPETAMRTLFYLRDIRGGQGERKLVHSCLLTLLDDPLLEKVIELIPEYGYWKDLMIFHNTSAWDFVVALINDVLFKDMENMSNNKPVTLLAKWMPSANAGKSSRVIANDLATQLGYTEREYRKILSKLRNYIDIVETKMCSNKWDEIKYESVPSKANLMYSKAFMRHDPERYARYIEAAKNGSAKINASTLNPCEIFSNVRNNVSVSTMDALWKSLPNYINTPYNGLVIADTSGSMTTPKIGKITPIDVSLSLATYIAERNPSEYWKGKFIVFSDDPELFELRGNTIKDYIKCFPDIVSRSTDLIKVANMIVTAGINHNIPDKDMPKTLIIISDMQFNSFDSILVNNSHINRHDGGSETPHSRFVKTFTNYGYTAPNIIYWNVNNSKNAPVKYDTYGTAFVTGYSPAAMVGIMNSKVVTPIEIMHNTVYNKRYDPIGNLFKS